MTPNGKSQIFLLFHVNHQPLLRTKEVESKKEVPKVGVREGREQTSGPVCFMKFDSLFHET